MMHLACRDEMPNSSMANHIARERQTGQLKQAAEIAPPHAVAGHWRYSRANEAKPGRGGDAPVWTGVHDGGCPTRHEVCRR